MKHQYKNSNTTYQKNRKGYRVTNAFEVLNPTKKIPLADYSGLKLTKNNISEPDFLAQWERQLDDVFDEVLNLKDGSTIRLTSYMAEFKRLRVDNAALKGKKNITQRTWDKDWMAALNAFKRFVDAGELNRPWEDVEMHHVCQSSVIVAFVDWMGTQKRNGHLLTVRTITKYKERVVQLCNAARKKQIGNKVNAWGLRSLEAAEEEIVISAAGRNDRINVHEGDHDLLPEEMRAILAVAKSRNPSVELALALELFCGIRPSQLKDLKWSGYHKVKMKVGKPRAVQYLNHSKSKQLTLSGLPWTVLPRMIEQMMDLEQMRADKGQEYVLFDLPSCPGYDGFNDEAKDPGGYDKTVQGVLGEALTEASGWELQPSGQGHVRPNQTLRTNAVNVAHAIASELQGVIALEDLINSSHDHTKGVTTKSYLRTNAPKIAIMGEVMGRFMDRIFGTDYAVEKVKVG